MKKLIALVLALVCVMGLVGCSNSAKETITFHDKTFIKSELSADTLEWLENYNKNNLAKCFFEYRFFTGAAIRLFFT